MNMLHAIYRHNTYKHPQPEIKGIFKHKLNTIVSIGGLLIDFSIGIITCQSSMI